MLTAALGHEVAHIARHDFALNLLHELISIPISFHPACWLIRRNTEQTREMACDEAVTSRLLDPPVYARSIMQLVDRLVAAEPPGYMLGVFDGNILETKIHRGLKRRAFNLKRARLLLAASASAMIVCVIIASTLAVTARAQSPYQSEMKVAGDAYNGGDFQTAAKHFAAAVDLASGDVSPRLFLANALLRAYEAKRESPDSRLLNAARSQYERVREHDSNNPQALAGLTTLAMHAKEFDRAREGAEKLSAVSPNEKTVWYTLGVLDWTAAYQGYQHAKQASRAPQESYIIPDSSLRESFRDDFRGRVEDGFNALQRALALDPQYGDVMAYKNLLYRLKAAMEEDPSEAKDLITKADAIVGEALAARKSNPPEPEPHRIDVEGRPLVHRPAHDARGASASAASTAR